MTTDHRARSRAIQPELPLPSAESGAGGRADGDWRLDEETRSIGRQGVAAARARLERARCATGDQGPAGRHRPQGRAA
jgi:hypothetical protein